MNDSSITVASGLIKTELAWMAGLFDGEGCVHLSRSQCSVILTNTYRPVVEIFHSAFPGYWTEITPQKSQHKTIYRWRRHGARAAEFIKAVRPYLKIKHKQADLLLEYVKTIGSATNGARLDRVNFHLRKMICEELTILNSTGQSQQHK